MHSPFLQRLTLVGILLTVGITCQAQTTGHSVGEKLPDLEYVDSDGAQRLLSEHSGKILFFHMYASWCPPCAGELRDGIGPLYNQLKDEAGLAFVICGFRETHQRTKEWTSSFLKLDIPVCHVGSDYRNDRTVHFKGGYSRSFGVPRTWIVGPDGTVLAYRQGSYQHWDEIVAPLRDAGRSLVEEQTMLLDVDLTYPSKREAEVAKERNR